MASFNGIMNRYIFGGCGGEGRLADLHAYDTIANTYTALPSPPDACAGRGGPSLGSSVDGSKIIVTTGFSGQENDDV